MKKESNSYRELVNKIGFKELVVIMPIILFEDVGSFFARVSDCFEALARRYNLNVYHPFVEKRMLKAQAKESHQ